METQEPSLLASGKAKWRSLLQETVWCLVVTHKTKHTLATLTSNHVPSYLPQGVERFCPHRNLPLAVYSSFIQNRQDVGATKMALRGCVDKESVVQPGRAVSLHANKTVMIRARKDVEEPERVSPSERSQCERPHPI